MFGLGSVGSKYKALIASTNDAFCPSLSGITGSKLHKSVNCVMEIVINGLTKEDIDKGIRESLIAISKSKYKKDIVSVSAGNYGGKLGSASLPSKKDIKMKPLILKCKIKGKQRLDMSWHFDKNI